MESFTEDELLATINDMGYDLTPEELIFFKREMDRFLDEMEKGSDGFMEDSDVSFKSLTKEIANWDASYGHDEDDMFYAERYRRLPSYENLEQRKKRRNHKRIRSSESFNHDERLDHDEMVDILDDGYRCLRNITEESNCLRDLNNRLEQSLRRNRRKLCSAEEYKQGFKPVQSEDETQEENGGEESDSTLVDVDPAIRPVLHPLPGGVPFRHDPVKKYEQYRKGWEQNPPPGEKKRLSLRWKVREFMLRRDISRVKPIDLARRRLSNPDWSPRPYLD